MRNDWFVQQLEQIRTEVRENNLVVLEAFRKHRQEAGVRFESLEKAFEKTRRGLEETRRGLEETQRGLEETQRGLKETQRGLEETRGAVKEIHLEMSRFVAGFDQREANIESTIRAGEEPLGRVINVLHDFHDGFGVRLERLEDRVERLEERTAS